MLGQQLVAVGDAHLGACPPEVEEAFLDFLADAHHQGDCLLLNGDVFDFWMGWKRVIPRHQIRAVAALAEVAKRMPTVMTGGNHDRWGGTFWEQELKIRFDPIRLGFEIGNRRVLAIHGDGITERSTWARVMFQVTRQPMAIAIFKALHPDLAFRIVDRMVSNWGSEHVDPSVFDRAAERQQAWAEAELQRNPGLGYVIMGHTHRPRMAEAAPGRWYVNPGAWLDGRRYGVVRAGGVELKTFR
ncbi:MAG: UDP-2,3-diacylglucosamine diphosphatase [Gemmatimonadales bacterium]